MGRGSPLCAKLRERIVSQFKDNFSQRKIAKNLGLSPSAVHNIVKRFRVSREVSECKGQGWKPLLNACDYRALRRYCLRNRHATMMDIATWAREYFGKSLSLNTVCRCIKKCNLKCYYANRKAFINFEKKRHRVLRAQSHLRWTERLFSGQMSLHFCLFFGKTDIGFYMPKMKKKTFRLLKTKSAKTSLWWYGGASVPTAWVICIYEKVPLMQRLKNSTCKIATIDFLSLKFWL